MMASKQEREEITMTKKEKEIYDFTKRHMKENNLSPFGGLIFFYIGGPFPDAKMENVLNVVNQLVDDSIALNKSRLASLMPF